VKIWIGSWKRDGPKARIRPSVALQAEEKVGVLGRPFDAELIQPDECLGVSPSRTSPVISIVRPTPTDIPAAQPSAPSASHYGPSAQPSADVV
jgi:hypothetical protein